MAKVGGPLRGSPVVTATAPSAGTANLSEGQAVSFNGSYTVVHSPDGAEVHGQVLDKLVNKDGALTAVVMNGVLRFSYAGASPVVGQSVVGSATAGKVKAAPTGRWLVIAVDTAGTTVDVER